VLLYLSKPAMRSISKCWVSTAMPCTTPTLLRCLMRRACLPLPVDQQCAAATEPIHCSPLQFLPMNYNSENVVEGKAAARAELRKR